MRIDKLKQLIDDSYNGIIVDIDDPEKRGRCKIMVFGVYGDNNDNIGKLKTEDIPWAEPYFGLEGSSKDGVGSFHTPKKDTVVNVIFDGSIYKPRYYSIEEIEPELLEELKDSYDSFHSLLWDKDVKLRLYYSKKSGFLLNLDNSIINILPDNSILIKHKNDSAEIELKGNDIDIVSRNAINVSSQNSVTVNSNQVHVNGATTDIGANPIYSSWNSEIAIEFLKIICTTIDKKYPNTPGLMTGLLQTFEPLMLSNTVKVSP